MDDHVVIGPEKVISSAGLDGAVARVRGTGLRFEFPAYRQPSAEGLDNCVGVIVAVIVDYYDLPIQPLYFVHRSERLECTAQGFRSVKRTNRHGHQHLDLLMG